MPDNMAVFVCDYPVQGLFRIWFSSAFLLKKTPFSKEKQTVSKPKANQE